MINYRFHDVQLYIIYLFEFTEDSIITNLPVRHESITVYPLSFEADKNGEAPYLVFWGFEINLAIKLGLKNLVLGPQVIYEERKAIFKDYMEFFFDIKDKNKNNPAKKLSAKLMMNSLYGKTGQDDQGESRLIPISDVEMLSLEELE
jgi:hypothetical protein